MSVSEWVKKSNKKNAKLISYKDGVYDIVFYFNGKVRIGSVKDGQYCRYGISTRGAMSSDCITSLWQSGPYACSEDDIKIMQNYMSNSCKLDGFDFSVIKDLSW